MNHKRKRPKSRRAGCLMCKPQKHQSFSKAKRESELHGAGGFGKIRAAVHSAADMKEQV